MTAKLFNPAKVLDVAMCAHGTIYFNPASFVRYTIKFSLPRMPLYYNNSKLQRQVQVLLFFVLALLSTATFTFCHSSTYFLIQALLFNKQGLVEFLDFHRVL